MSINEENILVISFNENNRSFKKKNCKLLIDKIYNENPLFLIVCTQKSIQNIFSYHFQYILEHYIKEKYTRINKYKIINKKKINGYSTTRTRIYININYYNKYLYNIINIIYNKYTIHTILEIKNINNSININIFNSNSELKNININNITQIYNSLNSSEECNSFFCLKNNGINSIVNFIQCPSNIYNNIIIEENENTFYIIKHKILI
jgi:hypothetical protein